MNNMQESSSVIDSDQMALVIDPDGGFSLLMPTNYFDAPVRPGHRLMLAIVAHLDDPEWVQALLADLQ